MNIIISWCVNINKSKYLGLAKVDSSLGANDSSENSESTRQRFTEINPEQFSRGDPVICLPAKPTEEKKDCKCHCLLPLMPFQHWARLLLDGDHDSSIVLLLRHSHIVDIGFSLTCCFELCHCFLIKCNCATSGKPTTCVIGHTKASACNRAFIDLAIACCYCFKSQMADIEQENRRLYGELWKGFD